MYSCQSRDGECKWGWAHWCSITVQWARTAPLMTGSRFAEWRKSREQREEFPPGSRVRVQEVFTFDFHIYSFFPPFCVFLNTRPKKYLAQLVLQIHSLVSSVDCQGHISRRLGFFSPCSLQNICLSSERPKMPQPWGSFKLYGISYYHSFLWFLLSFSHTRNTMPFCPQHTSSTTPELLLPRTPAPCPRLQGLAHEKDEKQWQCYEEQWQCYEIRTAERVYTSL